MTGIGHDPPAVGRHSGRPMRLLVSAGQILGQAMVFAGFLIPWATGAGILSGRAFTGVGLALTLRRLDLFLDSRVALFASLCLYLLPALCVAALLLSLFAPYGTSGYRRMAWVNLILGVLGLVIGVMAVVALQSQNRGLLVPLPQAGLTISLGGGMIWIAATLAGLRTVQKEPPLPQVGPTVL